MIILNIPTPPSTNNLFSTNKAGRRFVSPEYKAWREAAGYSLNAQRPQPISGPVKLAYEFKKGRADLGNLEKAATDLLVDYGIIDGDGPGVVVDIHLKFSDIEGARVTISSVASAYNDKNQSAEGQRDGSGTT